MNILDIQKKLCAIGLLDPPADGIYGMDTAWALEQVCGRHIHAEETPHPDVEAAVKDAKTLPLELGSDLDSRLVKGCLNKGYWINRHSSCLNIIYSEAVELDGTANDNHPNMFKAIRTLVQIVGGVPKVTGKWTATTAPSKYWTERPMNPLGAARLVPGQYKAWVMGTYHGPALTQVGNLAVQRDPQKIYKRYGPIYHSSNFGIHHHQGYNRPRNDEGHSCAGCCVGEWRDGHLQFINFLSGDARYKASHGYKFMAALLAPGELSQ